MVRGASEPVVSDRNLPLLALTLGDPSGIGPEVVVKALADPQIEGRFKPVVVGNLGALTRASHQVESSVAFNEVASMDEAMAVQNAVPVLSLGDFDVSDFPMGRHCVESGTASHLWVEAAAKMCIEGTVDGMVTGPVNKESWQISGARDLGHQEVFKRLTDSSTVYTMLVSRKLRCMHLSTHKSLAEACEFVTSDNVLTAIRVTHDAFRRWGFPEPRVAVAALNPHASDNGLIGNTEAEEITPAIESARTEGINAIGPVAADTVFNQAIGGMYEVVVVMHHDQGHIPIKVYGFEESVSVNLGLPFIRTSVDHGTAFDIAGQNKAQAVSMVEAIKLAIMLATKQGLA